MCYSIRYLVNIDERKGEREREREREREEEKERVVMRERENIWEREWESLDNMLLMCFFFGVVILDGI